MSNYIQEINEKINIEQLLTDIIGYAAHTDWSKEKLRLWCIFSQHSDTALQVNRDTKGYKCFGCDITGDYVNLYARHKGISDIEAAKELESTSWKGMPTQRANLPLNTKQKENHSSYSNDDILSCFKNASTEGGDSYFKSKKLTAPPIARYGNTPSGHYSTLIPKTNINGEFRGFEAISETGKYQYNTSHDDIRFTLLGKLEGSKEVMLGEGIATVQTVWEMENRKIPAIAVGSKLNLVKVANAIKSAYPNIKIIILADLDKDSWLPEPKAIEVQKLFPESAVKIPSFKDISNAKDKRLTDFNDLISKCEQTMEKAKERIIEYKINKQIIPAQKTELSSIKFLNELPVNYLSQEAPEASWLLKVIDGVSYKPFLRKGIVGQIVGAGGVGKTHLLTQIAIAVATGSTFLERYNVSAPGHAYMGLGENTEEDIHRILWKHARNLTPNDIKIASSRLAVQSFTGKQAAFIDKNGNQTDSYKKLREDLQKKEPESGWILIILDPISRFLGPETEKDNAAATSFIALLEELILSLKGQPTLLFGHHMSKQNLSNTNTDQSAARGSSAITDGVRWQANLEKIESDNENERYDRNRILFRVVKSNHTAITEPHMLIKDEYGCLKSCSNQQNKNEKKNKSNSIFTHKQKKQSNVTSDFLP